MHFHGSVALPQKGLKLPFFVLQVDHLVLLEAEVLSHDSRESVAVQKDSLAFGSFLSWRRLFDLHFNFINYYQAYLSVYKTGSAT